MSHPLDPAIEELNYVILSRSRESSIKEACEFAIRVLEAAKMVNKKACMTLFPETLCGWNDLQELIESIPEVEK